MLWLRIYAILTPSEPGFNNPWSLIICFEFLLFLEKLLSIFIMGSSVVSFFLGAAAFFYLSSDVFSTLRAKFLSVWPKESFLEPVLRRDLDLLTRLLSILETRLASHIRPLSVAFLFLKTWCQNSHARCKKCSKRHFEKIEFSGVTYLKLILVPTYFSGY